MDAWSMERSSVGETLSTENKHQRPCSMTTNWVPDNHLQCEPKTEQEQHAYFCLVFDDWPSILWYAAIHLICERDLHVWSNAVCGRNTSEEISVRLSRNLPDGERWCPSDAVRRWRRASHVIVWNGERCEARLDWQRSVDVCSYRYASQHYLDRW